MKEELAASYDKEFDEFNKTYSITVDGREIPITSEEKQYLADISMIKVSSIIDDLLSDPEANSDYFEDEFKDYDFTTYTRKQILETISVGRLFEAVREIFFNNKEADLEDELSDDIIAKKEYFYNNFRSLIILGKNKFQRLERGDLIEKNATDDETNGTTEFSAKEETSVESWQATHQISLHDSISNEFKRRFEKIFLSDEEGYYVDDKWGYILPVSVPSGEIINSMLEWFDGAITIEEMEEELKNHSNVYWTKDILEMIADEPLRSEFFTVMRKQKNLYTSVDNEGQIQYLNSQSKSRELLNEYITEYLNSKEKIKDENLEKLPSNTNEVDKLTYYLSVLKLYFPSEAIRVLENNEEFRKKVIKKLENIINTLQTYDLDTLFSEESRTNNSKEATKIYNRFKEMFDVIAEVLPNNIDSSFYEDGKMYQTYDNPNYFGTMISRIKYLYKKDPALLRKYIEDNFLQSRFFAEKDSNGKYVIFNPILDYLYNASTNFMFMKFFDKYNNLNSFDESFQDNPALLEMMTKMIMYHNKGNDMVKYFATPVMGDKSANYFVSLQGLSNLSVEEQSLDLFNQELIRIKAVLDRAKQDNIAEISKWDIPKDAYKSVIANLKDNKLTLKDFASLKGTGASFYFLPFLNNLFKEDTALGNMILEKIVGKEVDELQFMEEFNSYINKEFGIILDNEYQYMKRIGLFNTELNSNKKLESKYLSSIYGFNAEELATYTENDLKSLIKSFVFDSYFNTAYLTQLLITDLAFYGKAEAVQKRIPFVHSPRMVGNKNAVDPTNKNKKISDGKFRYLIFEDSEITSNIIDNISVALDQKIEDSKDTALATNLGMMKEVILNRFKKVIVTDAQAYTSITGLRKKLVILGKDNPALQEAYERIKQGNYNLADLERFTNPQKPMVFSNTMVDTGSENMGKVRKPTMIKDSEYLILLADALGSSIKGNNVNLLEIFTEIMEESADRFPTAGIDTITFPTAVKVGGKTALKIEGTTKEEIKANIEKYIYLRDSNNTITGFNENYVDAVDFDDWGLAQQVPYHFEDSQALEGSQFRALNVGDISPTTNFTIKETTSLNPKDNKTRELSGDKFIDEYFDVISKLTQLEANQLSEEFKLDETPFKKRKALSKFLINEIKKDAKYSYDLEWAVSLNEQGEFNMPLNDPTIKMKVTQLMNSAIKRAIHKQKVSGGPTVQVSSYGLSNNLNIRWKSKEGGLLLTKEEFGNKNNLKGKQLDSAYKKYAKENQGEISHFECYVPCPWGALAEAMTKEDGSMMSIEEAIKKGFMTEEMRYMLGYRIPTENVYSMAPLYIKGFLPRAAGEGIMLPQEITTLSGSDFDMDKLYLIVREINFKHEDKVGKADKQLKPLLKDTQKAKLQNKLFDLQWSYITSNSNTVKMFSSKNFDNFKRIYNIIKTKKVYNKLNDNQVVKISNKDLTKKIDIAHSENILLPSTNIKFHRQNMLSKKCIGIAANENISHSFTSMLNLVYNNFTEDFIINGRRFGISQGTNNRYSSLLDINGNLISANLAEFLSASIDAVKKEPILALLNINATTLPTALTMAKFGLSLDTIGLIMSNNILVRLIDNFDAVNLDSYTSLGTIINQWLTKIRYTEGSINSKLNSIDITDKFLLDNLTTEDKEIQTMILTIFKNFYKAAKDAGELTNFAKLNSSSSAAGPDIADNIIKKSRLDKFLLSLNSIHPAFLTNTASGIKNLDILSSNKYLKTIYTNLYSNEGIIYKMFSPYFIEYTQGFLDAKSIIESDSGLLLGKDEINSLVNWINMVMLLNNNKKVLKEIENINPLVNSYLDTKFISSVLELKKKYPDNKFLKLFSPRYNKALGKQMLITTKIPSTSTDKTDVINAWKDSLHSSDKNLVDMVNNLFIYQLLINGFGFSPKTALTLAPIEAKINYNYFDALNPNNITMSYANIPKIVEASTILFIRHNSYNPKIVKRLKVKDLNLFIKGYMPKEINIRAIENDYIDKLVSKKRSNGKDKEFLNFIRIEDTLYRYNSKTMSYNEVTTLGVSNTFIEPFLSKPAIRASNFPHRAKKYIVTKNAISVPTNKKNMKAEVTNAIFENKAQSSNHANIKAMLSKIKEQY